MDLRLELQNENKIYKGIQMVIFGSILCLAYISFAYMLVLIRENKFDFSFGKPVVMFAISVISLAVLTKQKQASISEVMDAESRRRKRWIHLLIMRLTLLMFSILFIILGIVQGELYDVISKAVIICSECIGLG